MSEKEVEEFKAAYLDNMWSAFWIFYLGDTPEYCDEFGTTKAADENSPEGGHINYHPLLSIPFKYPQKRTLAGCV